MELTQYGTSGLKVAEVPGFLANRHEVYAQARSEVEGLRTFLDVCWESYQDNRVGVDQLFDLAKEQKLLTELRSGRSDHGARVAMGMMLSTARDRIIGDYQLKQIGPGHGGVMVYQLLRSQPKPTNDQEKVPPDTGETSKNICARCHQPTGAHDVGLYLPDGAIVCRSCDGDPAPPTPNFIPTEEWQEVPDGAVFPPAWTLGGDVQYRMPLDGGKKQVRLVRKRTDSQT